MKISEMKYDQRKELAELLEAWLSMYVDEVYVKVMNQLPQIVENEMAMNFLRELKKRQDEEKEDRIRTIGCGFWTLEEDKKIEDDARLHTDCLSHSKSYRDVLYDMYIREKKEQ